MNYASVCDGIGAVHCAWQPLGWRCEWTSEIDAFPSAVVEQRWGFVNRGDMTLFKEWDDGASIDLLVGGTPCQSFSVAGLRKGLHDPRGGLMLTFLEIAQRHRPRWLVWENVPGVLSSNGGRDFGAFLGALGELGYGWAYRVLDAQWFGVAQRRRRVFVVGCLGDERRAAAVLFESESVRRDNPPSRAKGEGATAATSSGAGRSGEPIWRGGDQANSEHCIGHAGTLKWDKGQQGGIVAMPCVIDRAAFNQGQNAQYDPQIGESDLMSSLVARGPHAVLPQAFYSTESRCDGIPEPGVSPPLKVGSNGGGQPPAVAFTKSKRAQSTTDDESWVPGDVAPTFNCFDQGDTRATTVVVRDCAATIGQRMRGQDDACADNLQVVAFANRTRDGIKVPEVMKDGVTPALTNSGDGGRSDAVNVVVPRPVAFAQNQLGEVRTNGDVMGTVNTNQNASGRNTPMVMQGVGVDFQNCAATADVCGTLMGEAQRKGGEAGHGVMAAMAVRRLTPRECERLQGFPDDYTAIEYRKKPAADGPRYKALGNSMAVPVMRWIGERIAMVESTT